MAKGLDDLIEFLLEEIAVSGSRGVTIRDIAQFISSFYDGPEEESGPNLPTEDVDPNSRATVDRPLLSKVWSWLGRHPEVSIGDNRRYNKTSLAEIEIQFPNYLNAGSSHRQTPAEDSAASDRSNEPNTTPKKCPSPGRASAAQGPRISVSEARIHQAICGHPPDISKVVPLEFDLLSHIAAARSTGILQGDLVRASGQDKRSVPKRTDSLQKKGYITKEIVFRHGTRTSRLTLKKFAHGNAVDAEPFHKLHSLPQHGSTLRDVVRRIFDVLEDQNLISQTKLAEELSLGASGELAILSKIIRRLEKLKCIKRVRTAVGPSATSDDLRHFVQLLRRPDVGDLEGFDTEKLALNQTIEGLASNSDPEDQNDRIAAPHAAEEENEETSEAVYKPARWNPDRSMPNILVDAVRLAGSDGLTNLNARKMTTGDFVRRQLESLLHRISCESLIMQPQHLRHLAIVRTTVRHEGVVQYVHYSWDAFREKVADGHLDVSEIPGARQMMKELAEKEIGDDEGETSLSHANTDEFGFPLQAPLALQLRHGEATFFDLITAAAPGDVKKRNGEPTIVKQGTNVAMKIRNELPVTSSTTNRSSRRLPHPSRQPTRQPKRGRDSDDEEKTVIGRPRKYMRGTEKFWRMQFKQARLEAGANPDDLKKGTAQDPSAIALYAHRPANFDETLVQALEAGLPIPMLPEDINEDWIRSTRAIFDRSLEGIYMSPKGLRSDNNQRVAQIMIVKTPRLASVDFSDRTVVHPFRFLSSSASHSFIFRRYYPDLPTTHPSAPRTPRKLKRQSRIAPSKGGENKRQAPRLGIFYEDAGLSVPIALPTQLRNSTDVQLPVDVVTDTTDEEHGPPFEGTLTTNISSRATETIFSNDVRFGNGQARGGSLRSTQEQGAKSETQIAPSSRPDMAGTPRTRSTRNRKLTQKAKESWQSDQTRERRVLAETREVSSEVLTTDFELHNQASVNRDSEVFRAEKKPAYSTSHSPVNEPSTSISYSNVVKTRIAQHAQSPISNNEEMAIDANPSAGETEAMVAPSVERENPETPVSEELVGGITEASGSSSPSMSDRLQKHNHSVEGRDNMSKKSFFPPEVVIKKRVSKANRARTASVEVGDSGEESRPKNRHGQGTKRYFEGANALFRRIILQLIQETSGVVPNDPSTFKRVSLPRWQEAGGEGRPLLKTIKTVIKSLTESRRLKQVTFTFRGKAGIMVQRSIVFLPQIDPLSRAVENVKQNIINAEPTDYIPPEWRDEGYRIPLVNKKAPSRTPEVEVQPVRRRRASSPRSEGTSASTSSRDRRSRIKPAASPMSETPASSFLTLKVPTLGSLPVVHLHRWREECPVGALRSDTSDANPWKSSAFRPVRRRRRFEDQGSRRAGRSIIWRNFPSSLDDILQHPDLKLDYDAFQADDADWQRFACEVEGLRAWEEQEPDAALSKRSRFAFINHSVPEALYVRSVLPSAVEFSSMVQFDEDGSEIEVAYPPVESWAAFVNALQASPNVASRIAAVSEADLQSMPPPSPGLRPRRSNRPLKRRMSEDDNGFSTLPSPKRRRRMARAPDSALSRRMEISAFNTTKRRLPRNAKWLQTMPEEMIYRTAVAIIVVRTLAGGMSGFINWQIVMTLFPDQREEVIKARWNTLSTRYGSDIQNLTLDLQSKYLQALQVGEVASVAFDHVEATDWAAIVEWALKNLDHFNLKRIAHLPANRDELLDTYTLEFTQPKSFHNIAWNNTTASAREEVARSTVFGTFANSTTQPAVLRYQLGFELEMANPALRVAKSWVLATIFTPESIINPELAQKKLSTLAPNPVECDALLSRALKLLQDEKIIQRKLNDHLSEQGLRMRSWEAHRKLFERFEERGIVNPNVLRCAVTYKSKVLDQEFARGKTVQMEKERLVPDGEMVAVLNLMASGRVRLRPGSDMPKTRYGLDHERIGYRTKNLDKKLLGFSVELTPTKEYLFGDLRSGTLGVRQLPVPRGQADEPMGLIPMWVDIHGNVQMTLWRTVLVGVIGLVSQMPGVSASQISRAFGFVLDEAEVEHIMQWCIQCGFAKIDNRSKGYETLEWWWLCVEEAGE